MTPLQLLTLCTLVVTNRKASRHAAGHSLGGALATLAAYEFQAELKGVDIQCYTFGAPRTGNAAWARDFMQRVPECWHVINDRAFAFEPCWLLISELQNLISHDRDPPNPRPALRPLTASMLCLVLACHKSRPSAHTLLPRCRGYSQQDGQVLVSVQAVRSAADDGACCQLAIRRG